jgi:hypothetical protein
MATSKRLTPTAFNPNVPPEQLYNSKAYGLGSATGGYASQIP